MQLKRLAVSAVTVITGVAGLSLATSSPAAAAGVWRPYSTNPIESGWECGATDSSIASVYAQACVIESSDGNYRQAAVIVNNRRSSAYSARAELNLMTWDYDLLQRERCTSSGVAARSISVCFGETRRHTSGALNRATFNDVALADSPVN